MGYNNVIKKDLAFYMTFIDRSSGSYPAYAKVTNMDVT